MVSNDQQLILVDIHDQVIGYEEKLKTHQLGLLHRAFSVFLFRRRQGKIEFLLQQRSFHKYHCSGLWSNACCSHPQVGEDLLQAGQRRLQEELGIQADLQYIGHFIYRAELGNGLIEHEYDHVLLGCYEEEVDSYNLDEVAQVQWLKAEDLLNDLKRRPELYTPWLGQALVLAVEKV